jgi:DNA repair photolyase
MENYNIKVLSVNRDKTKFFGVDYFVDLCDGSCDIFKYFFSSIDYLGQYRNEEVKFNEYKFQQFKYEVQDLEPKKIVGIYQNPDIYNCLSTLKPVLEVLEKNQLGLFLETNSPKIIEDLDLLKSFSEKLPLLIAFPITAYQKLDLSIIPETNYLDNNFKLLHKLEDSGFNIGLVLKPLIPKINDQIEEMEKILEKTASLNLKFVYPSFTLYFDSFKLKNFYDIINTERPQLKNYYFDNYGLKYNWESENLNELKRAFVFKAKKLGISIAMRDIISLYRDDKFFQLKLF